MPRSWRDSLILGIMQAVPKPLARHALFLLKSHPALADSLGYHVRPIHYYEPLPDFREVDAAAAERRRVSPAIAFDLDGQRRLVGRLAATYGAELREIADRGRFAFANEYFAGFDAAVYYAQIRDLRPARIIEIGAGMSTRIAALALERNRGEGHPGALSCVEPYPQPRLTDQMPEVTLIQSRVEDLALDSFEQLGANDILFIDSSHVARFGGDVCREFLDILPRLKPGVWVHVHDVFFPRDYPAEWLVEQRLAFNEQYLLEAFLAFNHSYAVRLCLHWLWMEHREGLRAEWPGSAAEIATGVGPSSFWMVRVA